MVTSTGPHSHSCRHFSHSFLKSRTEEAFCVTGETLSWIFKKSSWFPHKTLATTWAGWTQWLQEGGLLLSPAEIETSVTFAPSRFFHRTLQPLRHFRSIFQSFMVVFSSNDKACCFWSWMYPHQTNIQRIHYCQHRTKKVSQGQTIIHTNMHTLGQVREANPPSMHNNNIQYIHK